MKFSRLLKRCISVAMIGVLFFAQMAVAAYVCPLQTEALSLTLPGVAQAGSRESQRSPEQQQPIRTAGDMPNCPGMNCAVMDADSPGLCHASCNSAGQSDQTLTVKLPVISFSNLPFVLVPALPVAGQGPVAPVRPSGPIATSRPLSVLYCCFRI